MKKAVRILQTLSLVLVVSAMALTGSISTVRANEKLDYKGMVEEIGGIFNEALSLYKKGNAQEAKLKAQSAYLEVFENELYGWHTDESEWPANRDLETFRQWFTIELHSVVEDLCDDQIIDDDDDDDIDG